MLITAVQGALAFEFAQGVIVDPKASSVYLMNPTGGIDVVSLSDGAVLATTTRAAKPLLLYDETLLAQAKEQESVLSLAGLKANDLKPAFTVDVSLPSGVHAFVDGRLGASFFASARKVGDVITVQWRSIQRKISGVPTEEPGHLSTGYARISARNGQLITSGEDKLLTRENADSEMLGNSAAPNCSSDNVVAAIRYSGDQVMLRRWNKAGKPLPEINLFDGELTFRTFSRDCRHLLASKAANGWTWYIYSVASGKRLTDIHSSEPSAEFFVWGDTIIYGAPAVRRLVSGQLTMVESRRLQAIDFTGKELWARPIRDTAYRGPYPGGHSEPIRPN